MGSYVPNARAGVKVADAATLDTGRHELPDNPHSQRTQGFRHLFEHSRTC